MNKNEYTDLQHFNFVLHRSYQTNCSSLLPGKIQGLFRSFQFTPNIFCYYHLLSRHSELVILVSSSTLESSKQINATILDKPYWSNTSLRLSFIKVKSIRCIQYRVWLQLTNAFSTLLLANLVHRHLTSLFLPFQRKIWMALTFLSSWNINVKDRPHNFRNPSYILIIIYPLTPFSRFQLSCETQMGPTDLQPQNFLLKKLMT